jgi:hypothetical protein
MWNAQITLAPQVNLTDFQWKKDAKEYIVRWFHTLKAEIK